jgi:ABC-type phosphate transport system substrate-binding protein
MKNRYRILMLFFCSIVCCGVPVNVISSEVLIIANPSVPANSLGPKEIKNLFLGKTTQWENHETVTIVVSKDINVHKSFLDRFIKRTDAQFKNVWRQNLFTGKGKQPVKVETSEELLKYVSETKGAIGYIFNDASIPEDVKVLVK